MRNPNSGVGPSHIHFRGLDTLRFFAAYTVLIVHSEEFKDQYGLPNIHDYVGITASLSVGFFFVLSGFLITFLLVQEKKRSNTISIRNFYVKRILRIWPLYYILAIIGLFIAPHIHFTDVLLREKQVFYNNYGIICFLMLTIMPNIAKSFFTLPPLNGHLWSLGIEEQFYIVWPWITKKVKKLMPALIVIYFGIEFLKFFPLALAYVHIDKGSFFNFFVIISKFLNGRVSFDYMAIGAIAALLYQRQSKLLRFFTSRMNKFLIAAIIAILSLTHAALPYIKYDYFAFLFAALILFVVIQTKETSILENRILKYLGKISYGIYMYHPVAISIVIYFMTDNLKGSNSTLTTISFYLICSILTLGIASLSYELIESKLLNLKSKFLRKPANLASTDPAVESAVR